MVYNGDTAKDGSYEVTVGQPELEKILNQYKICKWRPETITKKRS
jgi:hypothetical protein